MNATGRLEEHHIWLSLVSLWSVGSLIAWSVAATVQLAPLGGSRLTVLALLTTAIGLTLRLPILDRRRSETPLIQEAVWGLGLLASINWSGFTLLRCERVSESVPGLLILLCGEGWLLAAAHRQSKLAWTWMAAEQACDFLRRRWQSRWPFASGWGDHAQPSPAASWSADAENQSENATPPGSFPASRASGASLPKHAQNDPHSAPAAPHPPVEEPAEALGPTAPQAPPAAEMLTEMDSAAMESADGDGLPGELARRCIEGRDELGQRYMSGEVRVELQPELVMETVVVGFCPPFSQPPLVELEYESTDAEQEFELKVVNVSPMGMRVHVRRPRSPSPASLLLLWYAVEPSTAPQPGPLADSLP